MDRKPKEDTEEFLVRHFSEDGVCPYCGNVIKPTTFKRFLDVVLPAFSKKVKKKA